MHPGKVFVSGVFWLGLIALLLLMLVFDLSVFHRDQRAQTTGEALLWSIVWIGAALAFNGFVYFAHEHHWFGIGLEVGHEMGGRQAALEFFTAYLIEKSLSLDNIFVIAMVFTYFAIPLENQHRVLFWGVLGALVMRALFILSGLALVERFAWTTYVFGALLLVTAVKMMIERHDNLRPEKNALVRLLARRLPVTDALQGGAFLVRVPSGWAATPLFLALLVVETSNLLFAVDSVPAVIAVTRDPFLVFSSNAFAILGLRSLYFAIAPLIARFRYLRLSLIFVLAFVGVKMLLAHHHPLPTAVSLTFIAGILGVGVLASLLGASRDTVVVPSPVEDELDRLVRVSLPGARRFVVAVVGATVLLAGVAMLVLPGPGLVVIPIGLAVLSTEFVWARRWLTRLRETIERDNPLRGTAREQSPGDETNRPPKED